MAVQDVAQAHLPFEAHGYVSTNAMVYDILLKAATENISIDAVCRDLEKTIGGNTLRELINETLTPENLSQHEQEINQALSAHLPRQIRKSRLQVAIDEHDEPFYGKSGVVRAFTIGSQAKKGTTHFFRIVSVYVFYRQMRLTLAIAFVRPEDNTVSVIKKLVGQVQKLNLRIRVLYLDRGFCFGAVLSFLDDQGLPAVIACSIRGKHGGTRQLCCGRKSYATAYTFTDGTTVHMAVVATLVPGKDKKRRRKWQLFVVRGITWPPKLVYQRYRSRFGIESSYRILRRVRIKTTSRNPAFRFFALGFALLLVNLWALLRWFVARIPGPGPHRVHPVHFQFQMFVSMLRRVIEQLYVPVMSVPILASVSKP